MADLLLGGIAINEILADPNSGGGGNFDTDGNGIARGRDEFVELVNTSNAAIDISGLELWDAGRDNWFTFPPGTVLQPGAHAMVIVGVQNGGSLPTGAPGDLFFDAGLNSGNTVINNNGDNIVVYDPGADEYISATFNGDALDDPTTGSNYAGFSATATQVGAGEDFGNDIDGFSIQRAPDGSDSFVNDATPTPGTENICFADGTAFDTPAGPVLIENLRPGDLLMTGDHGAQEIQWIWSKRWTASDVSTTPALQPVRLRKGALGRGLPRQDLYVSQHHRILVKSKIAGRMLGATEILVPAKDLVAIDGIDIIAGHGVITYFHVLLKSHEILLAEGLPVESLFLGNETINALDPVALSEICVLLDKPLPKLTSPPDMAIRYLEKGRRVRKLATRHKKNRMPLLAGFEAG